MQGLAPALRDPSLPRLHTLMLTIAGIRLRNVGRALRAGKPVQAMRAVRPAWYCVCTSWGPCKAYYNAGWYTYCSSCGTYSTC